MDSRGAIRRQTEIVWLQEPTVVAIGPAVIMDAHDVEAGDVLGIISCHIYADNSQPDAVHWTAMTTDGNDYVIGKGFTKPNPSIKEWAVRYEMPEGEVQLFVTTTSKRLSTAEIERYWIAFVGSVPDKVKAWILMQPRMQLEIKSFPSPQPFAFVQYMDKLPV